VEDSPQDIEELTAYLDGELDQESHERVEARLGSDPQYLAVMQQLQQTWDLLDRASSAEPAKSFTKTTMELAVGDELKRKSSVSPWTRVLRVAAILAIPAILFATSYAVISNKQNQPDRILLESLSVIDSHPYYTIAKNDNEFVDGLLELFLGSSALATPDFTSGAQGENEFPAMLPEGLEDRRSYVVSLSPQKKVRLEKQMTEFFKKPQAKQDALSKFDREVRSQEDASERLYVLKQYYEWLRSLKQEERTACLPRSVWPRLRKSEMFRPAKNSASPGCQKFRHTISKRSLRGMTQSVLRLVAVCGSGSRGPFHSPLNLRDASLRRERCELPSVVSFRDLLKSCCNLIVDSSNKLSCEKTTWIFWI